MLRLLMQSGHCNPARNRLPVPGWAGRFRVTMTTMEPIDLCEQLHTVRDFLRWGVTVMNEAELCFGHGTADAASEAGVLLGHVLSLPLPLDAGLMDARLSRTEKQRLLALFRRRVEERVPAAYLVGEAYFAGLPFRVDERVIVPRSPLAELVEQRFAPWLDRPRRATHILDLCAGSGCIGIACAHYLPWTQVDLAELSPEALEVAEQNILEHGVEDRVAAIQSDLFQGLPGQRYDIIVSNPPYVGAAELAALPEEFAHEPELALAGGEHGIDLVATLLEQAPRYLSEQGLLVVEVGATWPVVAETWPHLPFHWLRFRRGGEGVFLLFADELRSGGGPPPARAGS